MLQCSRLSDDDDDSMVDSDVEFDAVLRSTSDATAADGGYTEDTVISAEQVISEIESMLEVRCFITISWQIGLYLSEAQIG